MEADGADGADGEVDADPALILDKLDAWIDGFFALLPNIAMALVLFAVFVGLALGVSWSIRRSVHARTREDLGAVLGSVAKWVIIAAGLLLSLTVVVPTLNLGDLVAGLGIGSIAIGFAFKDILQNLLAGILILYRQPFRVGDQIIAGGNEGTVEHIETRATKMRTYDGRRVVIPNSDVFTGVVVVNTAYGARRSEQDFPIALTDDWSRAVAVALDAARGAQGVVADPAPDAQAQDIGDLAKLVRVRWWTNPLRKEVVDTASRVRLAVEAALLAEGFTIPRRTDLRIAAEPERRPKA